MSLGGALAWDRTVSSVDDAAKMVSIVNAQAAKAMFTIQTPVGGSWIVSLVGARTGPSEHCQPVDNLLGAF